MADSKFLGTDLLVYIGATPIANSRSATFKVSSQFADSTTKDSAGAFTESIPSTKSWELSTEGLAVWGDLDQWIDAVSNGTQLSVSFKPLDQVTGDIAYSGFCYVESCEVNADNAEVVTYTVQFKPTGPLNKTVKA